MPQAIVRGRRSAVAVWVVLVVAGSLLAFAARGAGPLPGDLAFTRWVQFGGPPGLLLARAGDVVWFLPLLAIMVALLARWWLAAFILFVAGCTAVLVGVAIKFLVARPRPSAHLVQVYDIPEGYGFPSSTALLSVVLLGTVGYLVWQARPRRSVVVVTFGVVLTLTFLIGLSRVYVGEHWATDVLGGWLFGAPGCSSWWPPIAGGYPDGRSRNAPSGVIRPEIRRLGFHGEKKKASAAMT
jgi:membrane-associated phospholipid phosphatase